MIFSTFNQLDCFLIFLFYGIISGLISNLFSAFFLIKQSKKYKKIIFDAFFCSFHAIKFNFLINFYNLGKFSIVLAISYLVGILWIELTSKNLVVFLSNKWYNYINKRKSTLKIKHDSVSKKS